MAPTHHVYIHLDYLNKLFKIRGNKKSTSYHILLILWSSLKYTNYTTFLTFDSWQLDLLAKAPVWKLHKNVVSSLITTNTDQTLIILRAVNCWALKWKRCLNLKSDDIFTIVSMPRMGGWVYSSRVHTEDRWVSLQ